MSLKKNQSKEAKAAPLSFTISSNFVIFVTWIQFQAMAISPDFCSLTFRSYGILPSNQIKAQFVNFPLSIFTRNPSATNIFQNTLFANHKNINRHVFGLGNIFPPWSGSFVENINLSRWYRSLNGVDVDGIVNRRVTLHNVAKMFAAR